jgi:protein SCO1
MSLLAGNSALRLRQVSRVLVPALVVVVGIAILAHDRLAAEQATARSGSGSGLRGYDLGGTPAPGFTLRDQNGAAVSLAALAGRPVVLTFLYTHCPDECPLTAEKLHTTAQALGDRASGVEWLAVSLDPVGDTPQAVRDFVTKHRLTGVVHFLVGSQQQLAPIWSAYHIEVERAAATGSTPQAGGLGHSAAVYLIDARGRERAFYTSEFAPEDLASDLRTLLER